nr:immunoglobulin light chain junction region [Macaca mulatta]
DYYCCSFTTSSTFIF